MNETYLYHHGILGMKWGRERHGAKKYLKYVNKYGGKNMSKSSGLNYYKSLFD